jgi:hypothetical protein
MSPAPTKIKREHDDDGLLAGAAAPLGPGGAHFLDAAFVFGADFFG